MAYRKIAQQRFFKEEKDVKSYFLMETRNVGRIVLPLRFNIRTIKNFFQGK